MQERDTYDKIRSKLMNAEVQAPDFDALFGKDTLGSDSLRSALASKLADHTAEAPDFEQLFAGETLGKPVQPPKIRMFPWWSVASVVAACLAVILLLPKQVGIEIENLSNAPATQQVHAPIKRVIKAHQPVQQKQFTPLLATPTKIKLLSVESNKTAPEIFASIAVNSNDTTAERDTSENGKVIKINPSRATQLAVHTTHSVEEAYADAKVRKGRSKPDKMTLGIGMNSANRLLSMVNSKSDGNFALQAVANSSSDGYASIEGASASLLRTTTSSVNEWEPSNISADLLDHCETNYFLPINFGLTVSISIIRNLNLITGLQYTYIANHITGNTFDLKQELHYLGIPVKIAVNLVKRGDFVVYSALGGTVEKGIAGVQHSNVDGEDEWKGTQSIQGFQTSLTGQFGVSYNLNHNFLLYFEPGVAWYIPSDQPLSNRTEEPFNFNLALGIRYQLQ